MCIFVFKKWYEASIVMPYLFVFVCAGSSLLCGGSPSYCKQDYFLVGVHEPLIVVVSLVGEHGLQGSKDSVVVAHGLQSRGPAVLVHGLSCPSAGGIFPRH